MDQKESGRASTPQPARDKTRQNKPQRATKSHKEPQRATKSHKEADCADPADAVAVPVHLPRYDDERLDPAHPGLLLAALKACMHWTKT